MTPLGATPLDACGRHVTPLHPCRPQVPATHRADTTPGDFTPVNFTPSAAAKIPPTSKITPVAGPVPVKFKPRENGRSPR